MELPYLTSELPGIGGRIKEDVQDFRVEEVPLYDASGQGTHLYFRVTKRGIPTHAAVERIARHMGVNPMEIGFAGMKDAQAMTSQVMSLEHADAARLETFKDSQVQVEVIGLHTNKIRPGHLAGNRFVVRIRGVGAAQLPQAMAIWDVLLRRGVPNYFGEQRFGARGDTAKLGELLVRDDLDKFIKVFLGRSMPNDPPDCKAARDAFDTGFFNRALDRWPRHYVNERKALAAYKKRKHAGPAVAAIDKRMKRLYVSAFQSEIFNEVLAERIGTIDQVFAGDLAVKVDSGGVFMVEDPSVEQPRAAAFEISPSGPIIGYRTNLAGDVGVPPASDADVSSARDAGVSPASDAGILPASPAGVSPAGFPPTILPGRIERDVLARHGVSAEDFRHVGHLKIKGTRRELRFRISQPDLAADSDARGEFIQASFIAPSGCYATVALREIMKVPETKPGSSNG